ncbi:MAG: Fic family protein [Ilumatobacter sp.]
MSLGVPILPALDEELIRAHDRVHGDLADALDAANPHVSSLFRRFQRRVFQESLANVFLDHGPALMRPRRRFLTSAHRARLNGCDAAFRHVDSRLAMWRHGHVADVVGSDTLTVLNALVESHNPSSKETNPGLVRMTSAEFHEIETDYVPPPGSECAEILDAAIDMVERAPAPAITRAGWLCAVLLAVHPFVDGNGRTARMAFQLVNSSGLTAGIDWGSIEQWSVGRQSYVQALKASQQPSAPTYRAEAIDTLPFIEYACRASIAGAAVVHRRLTAFDEVWHSPWSSASDDHRLIETAAWADSSATVDELTSLVSDPTCSVVIADLVLSQRLQWGRNGTVAIAPEHPIHSVFARH